MESQLNYVFTSYKCGITNYYSQWWVCVIYKVIKHISGHSRVARGHNIKNIYRICESPPPPICAKSLFVCNWKTFSFPLFFFFTFSFMIECAWRRKSSPILSSLYTLTHHYYYPLSNYSFFLFLFSAWRCQETVAHYIDYGELGFSFDYLMPLSLISCVSFSLSSFALMFITRLWDECSKKYWK